MPSRYVNSVMHLRYAIASTFTFAVAVVGLGPVAVAQSSQSSPIVQDITVIKRSEGEGLALGYADAFRYISRSSLFLTYQIKGQKVVTLEGFRELKASGSILVITTERGAIIAIPAVDVISLTTERPAGLP
jgi:hypothetical protein